MKRYKSIILAAVLSFSLVSCADESTNNSKNTSENIVTTTNPEELDGYGPEEDDYDGYMKLLESVDTIIGSENEADYQQFIDMEYFTFMYAGFTDPENSLKLINGVPEDPVVTKPFKSIFVGEEISATPMNMWIFPVVDNGNIIGFINADCRYEISEASLYSGVTYANELNNALKNGTLAVFQPYNKECVYAIFENNEIINLLGDEHYEGPEITFDEISSFGFALDESSLDDIVYSKEQYSAMFDSEATE